MTADRVEPSGSADELKLARERERAAARAVSLAAEQRRRREESPAGGDGQPASAVAPEGGGPAEPASTGRLRRPRFVGAVAATVVAAVLLVALATYDGASRGSSTRPARVRQMSAIAPVTRGPIAMVTRGHLRIARRVNLGSPASGLSVSPMGFVWASVPAKNDLVEVRPNQPPMVFSGIPDPGPIAAGSSGVWVTLSGQKAVARWAAGQLRGRVTLSGRPVAIVLGLHQHAVWAADSSGAISHVIDTTSSPAATRVSSAPVGLAVGEPNWIWAVDGSLVRIDPTDLSTQTFRVGADPVGVAVNQGIWVAHANGAITRFGPQPGQPQSVVALSVPTPLSGIAAHEGSSFVWAISRPARSLYEISIGQARVVGVVRFNSAPTHVAVTHLGVWVTTARGSLIRVER